MSETVSISTLSPQELDELCRSGRSVDLIDVRTPAEFREVHAAIARNVPLETFDPEQAWRQHTASTDDPLYVICRSGSRARQACERFVAAGYTQVVSVEGGTDAWVNAGLPVVRGKKAFALDRQMRILAGALVLIGVLLAAKIHIGFIAISGFIGAGLIFAGITDTCPMSMGLAKMPWNQVSECSKNSCSA